MLMLYRKLCRHLYGLDQDSAVFYVNHYREMFDEDSSQKFEPMVWKCQVYCSINLT